MSDSKRLNHRQGTQLIQTTIKEGWDRAASDSLIEGFQLGKPRRKTTWLTGMALGVIVLVVKY